MTRVDDMKHRALSWERANATIPEDGKMHTGGDAARPKGRIRRSMTACNTCRKLKTRCDLDPRSHACRRCISLRLEPLLGFRIMAVRCKGTRILDSSLTYFRIDCQLPETGEKFHDNISMWSDATASIPSIEERLASLERSIGEMTRTMRQMMDRSPSMSSASTSQLARSVTTDETASYDGSPPSPLVPKPVHMIQELHSEFFGEMDGFGAGANFQSDIVSKGIIDSKLSLKLTQL